MFQVHFPNKSFEAATLIEAYIIEQWRAPVNRGPVEPYNEHCMGILATANRSLKTGSASDKDIERNQMMTLKPTDFLGAKPVVTSKRTPVTFGSNGMTSRRLFPLPHWPRAPPSPSSPSPASLASADDSRLSLVHHPCSWPDLYFNSLKIREETTTTQIVFQWYSTNVLNCQKFENS